MSEEDPRAGVARLIWMVRANRWRGARMTACVVLAIFGLIGGLLDRFKVCEETVSIVPGRAVEYCHAPGPTDLSFMSGLLLVLLLLLPDVSEIGVAGALTVKRRLDNTEQRQEFL